jgi:hypothetical protein
MSIPVLEARRLIDELSAGDLTTLIAQAEAQHVLYEVGEDRANFPPFAEGLDDRVTALAYIYLAAGCSLAELGERAEGAASLERGARLLRSVHGPHARANRESAYHILLAAMAAYAAGQYSWAFVMLQSVEQTTMTARLVAAYLRRERLELQDAIGDALYGAATEADDVLELGIERAVARALGHVTEFIHTGRPEHLDAAHVELDDAMVIATDGLAPAAWWIIRLLKLMFHDLQAASPWTVVPPFFGPSDGSQGPNSVDTYCRMLACDERPVYELWRSQREALPQALGDNSGAVVSLRTSAGKTRVAELAIMQTLAMDAEAKVVYLAPFRSLAFELENTLGRTMRPLEYRVSHLYGGSRASRSDAELASDAHVIIATPEKARALFRADPSLFAQVKLFVIDEGHLIGGGEREVRNELYLEHLRVRARSTGARFLLLSAVLPNGDEIAEWIGGSSEHVGTSPWRPSVERFGVLGWNGTRVRLDWRGDSPSFNPKFVEARPVSNRKKARQFPGNKTEAVAATAVRLWNNERPVMIFVSQARSVAGVAEACMTALSLDGKATPHQWPEIDWGIFKTLCEEELPPDAVELKAAEIGVICHSNRLPTQVRLAMEHLMRSRPPRIVIATSTLAQGVNIGVNSVIVHSTLMNKDEYIGSRDFWNIAGRAGRAFVDVEGKILYAIDETDAGRARRERNRVDDYFKGMKQDPVTSGVLQIVQYLKQLAARLRLPFAQLLEMAAEDNFSKLGEGAEQASELCDFLDDALLALHMDGVVNAPVEPPEVWIEKLFRDSLAVMQAAARPDPTPDEVLAFVRARAMAALRRAPTQEMREAIVASSLPLTVALRLFDDRATWEDMLSDFVAGIETETLPAFVARAEEWLRINGSSLARTMPEAELLEQLRAGWLSGVPLRTLCSGNPKAHAACRDFYGFTLPWVVHAAGQQFKALGDEGRALLLSRIALSIENGLPTEYACQLFLAGVLSRTAAVELSNLDTKFGPSISDIAWSLRRDETVEEIRPLVSPATAGWLDLMTRRARDRRERAPTFRRFTLPKIAGALDVDTRLTLVVRSYAGVLYLSSPDGRARMGVSREESLPFEAVLNDPRFCFRFENGAWQLVTRDPKLRI